MSKSMENHQSDELFGQPKGLYVLFFTEMWERFSYYGMRAILVLYMVTSATGNNPGLGWKNSDALALYGWYTMFVYLMSIPGGILADKYIGQKKAVLYGGLTLVLGHSILAIQQSWAFFLGLALIILGVGGLKPNISSMVGGLYPKGDDRRDGGFTIFYIGINLGAFLAAIIVGFVGEKIGWHYGFGLAGIGMLLGQIVYMAGQKYLTQVGNPPSALEGKLADDSTSFGQLFNNLLHSRTQLAIVVVSAILFTVLSFKFNHGLERYLYAGLAIFLSFTAGILMMIYKDINSIEKDRFVVLLISFLIIIVFWGAFEQAGGLLNIYTDVKIDRVVNKQIIDILFYGGGLFLLIKGLIQWKKNVDTKWIFLGVGLVLLIGYAIFQKGLGNPFEIPTSVFQSVNALFIIIFGTAVSGFWYYWKHKGHESSSLFKMAIGTIIMGIGFLFMAKASKDVVQYGDKAALILLILAYLFHTIGELCASPVALSFITKIAPVKYVAIMMGVYFASTGLGNKLAGSIGEASQAEKVKVALVNHPEKEGVIADSIFNKALDFELVGKAYLDGDNIVMEGDQNLQDYIQYDDKNKDLLKEYLSAEDASQDNPQTIIADFTYDKDKKAKVDEGLEPANEEDYSGSLEVFSFQNKLEFKTFVSIFGLTLVFGLLLLLFLKKLKKLTHGAEDIPEEDEYEPAEGYELGDEQFREE